MNPISLEIQKNSSMLILDSAKSYCSQLIMEKPLFLIGFAFILYLIQNLILPLLPDTLIKSLAYTKSDLNRLIFVIISLSLLLSGIFIYLNTSLLRA